MKYILDNDLHIHSKVSLCSSDEKQTTQRILNYAIENNLKTICLTNHFWDENVEGSSDWYKKQNYNHIITEKPLPQNENVSFLFGCETDLNHSLELGISKEMFDKFDFIVIPTTHFHMKGFTLSYTESANVHSRADVWERRLKAVLEMDLPFHKIGIAHLTCNLIAPTRKEYIEVLELLHEEEMKKLFSKAAQLGVGIELNSNDMSFSLDESEIVLRPYRIAKQCGCKFYCGSDAHHPDALDRAKDIFKRAVDLLDLQEEDKFLCK